MKSSLPEIKREQKKSLYLQKLSEILHQLAEQEDAIGYVYISRLDLSADTGICYLYFASYPHPTLDSKQVFEQALEILKLYKPSLRKAFARQLKNRGRYVPDLFFKYDDKQEQVRSINNLLDQVQGELKETKEEEEDDS